MPKAVQVLLRTSERTTFAACRQKWWWAYRDRLVAHDIRPTLEFGTLTHEALAIYYKPGRKRGLHPAKAFVQVYRDKLESGQYNEFVVKVGNNYVDPEELGVHMLTNYVDHYGADERYEVIASEQAFQVDVRDPLTKKYLFTYVGKFDGVWRDLQTGMLVFPEHKTGVELEPRTPETMDEQIGSYWTYGPIWLRSQGVLKRGEDVDHVLMNRLAKRFKDDRPENELGQKLNMDGRVSKQQPPPLFKRTPVMRAYEDRRTVMRRSIAQAREMRLLRAGKLEVWKNPAEHCRWCQFSDMCELHEIGDDWESFRDAMFTTWNPYDDHDMEVVP